MNQPLTAYSWGSLFSGTDVLTPSAGGSLLISESSKVFVIKSLSSIVGAGPYDSTCFLTSSIDVMYAPTYGLKYTLVKTPFNPGYLFSSLPPTMNLTYLAGGCKTS